MHLDRMAKGDAERVLVAEAGSNTSKHHWSVDVKWPVYSVQFVDERVAVLAGGGGASRSGVMNQLVSLYITTARLDLDHRPRRQTMYSIDDSKRQLELVHQHQLSKDEDAPMTIAVDPAVRSLPTAQLHQAV